MRNILVHEPTPRWTAVLERHLADREDTSIAWHPQAADLLADCETTPDSVAVLVCPADAAALHLVASLAKNPGTRILCLLDEENLSWELSARELGATSVLPVTVPQRRILDAVLSLQ